MECRVVLYGIRCIYIRSDRSIFYRYVHSIGDDDVMSENSIVFMFIIGCATVLALFGMYIAYKIEMRD